MDSEQASAVERALRARDALSQQFLRRPEVSLIDIGYDPEDPGHPPRLVLRVHVRGEASAESLGLPPDIDGIPVRVLPGDYQLE